MAELKRILVPTDFSENSRRACAVAQALAQTFNSKVDLLHVIPSVKYLHENLLTIEYPLNIEEEIIPKMQERIERQLEELQESSLTDETRGQIYINMDRKIPAAIAAHAEEKGYDLIVIGARGKDASGMFRGSTTTRVIRRSDVPVMSVDRDLADENLETIMVATDLSPLSLASFPLAALIGSAFGSRLMLFHNLEGRGYDQIEEAEKQDELLKTYEELIDRLESFLSDTNTSYITITREGNPFEDMVTVRRGQAEQTLPLETVITAGGQSWREVVHRADESADLLVMTTLGYSGRSIFRLGSVADKVTQQLKKPVLTLRPDQDLFRSDDQRASGWVQPRAAE